MKCPLHTPSVRRAGFSLVELTIVVVILGVLSMMAVPRFKAAVERSKASEAYVYLHQIQGAQERYRARKGEYAKQLSALDLEMSAPEFFKVGTLSSPNWQNSWQLRLTRDGASSGYGAYSVAFTEDGFSTSSSSIPAEIAPSPPGVKAKTAASKSKKSKKSDDDDDDKEKKKESKKGKKAKRQDD